MTDRVCVRVFSVPEWFTSQRGFACGPGGDAHGYRQNVFKSTRQVCSVCGLCCLERDLNSARNVLLAYTERINGGSRPSYLCADDDLNAANTAAKVAKKAAKDKAKASKPTQPAPLKKAKKTPKSEAAGTRPCDCGVFVCAATCVSSTGWSLAALPEVVRTLVINHHGCVTSDQFNAAWDANTDTAARDQLANALVNGTLRLAPEAPRRWGPGKSYTRRVTPHKAEAEANNRAALELQKRIRTSPMNGLRVGPPAPIPTSKRR